MARYTVAEAEVSIVPTMRGFASKVNAGVKAVKAPPVMVQVDIDRAALAKAEQAARKSADTVAAARDREAAAAAKVKIAEAQLAEAREKSAAGSSKVLAAEERLRSARASSVSASRTATKAAIDEATAHNTLSAAKAKAAASAGGGNKKITFGTDVDTGAAAAQLGAFVGRWSGKSIRLPVDVSTAAARAGLATIEAGTSVLTSKYALLGSAGVAAFALVGPAVGALSAALVGAGAGIGAITVGLSGVKDAFTDLGAADDAAASDGAAAAKSREASAAAVKSAIQGVEDAKRQESRTQVQGNQQIEDAERSRARTAKQGAEQIASGEASVRAAQERSQLAQEDLTRARKEAREGIEDLKLSLSGAALSEESAQIGLERAQERLNKAIEEGATGLDLREANLGVKEATQSLAEAKERYGDVAEAAQHADRVGVEGSDGVVAAQRQAKDASDGVRAAEADLERTRESARQANDDARRDEDRARASARQANEDAAQAVIRAQAAVQEASKSAGNEASSAATKAAQSMAKLSPEAQAFVLTVRSLASEWGTVKTAAQDALFAGLDDSFRALTSTYVPILKTGLAEINGEVNTAAKNFVTAWTSPAGQQAIKDAMSATAGFVRSVSPAVTDLSLVFTQFGATALAALSGPLGTALQQFADSLGAVFAKLADTGVLQQAMGVLGQVLGAVLSLLPPIIDISMQLFVALGPGLAAAITSIGQALGPLGQILLALAPLVSILVQAIAGLLTPILTALAPVVSALVPPLMVLADMLASLLAGAIVALMPLLTAVAQIVGQVLTAALNAIAPIIPIVVTAISMLATALIPVVEVVGQVVVVLLGALAPILPVIAGLITTLVQAITPLLGLIAPLVSALLPPLVTIITAVIGVFEVLAPVIGQVIAAIVMLVVQALTPILPMLGELFQIVADSIVPILPQLAGLFMAVIAALLPLLPPLLDLVAQLLPMLIEVIKFLVPIITWLVGIIVDVLTWAINNILAPALRFIADIFSWVGDVWRALGDGMQWVYDHVIAPMITFFVEKGQWLKDKFFEFTDWIGRKWSELQDMFKTPINWVIREVWNKGVGGLWRTAKGIIPALPDWTDAQEFASGGLLPGYSPGVDDRLIAVGGGEAIMRPEVGRAMGKAWVDRVNATAAQRGPQGVAALLRYGGDNVPRFAAGGIADPATVDRAKNFARSQDGKPYQWAGVGNPSWDCSGFMSGVLLSILGKNAFGTRVGTTATMPWRGFERGADPGGFTIGNTANAGGGIGHMAGTLAGMAVESNGSQGVMAGRGRGSQQGIFTGIYHLAGLTDGTSILDDIGNWIGGVVASIRSMIEPIYDGAANGIRSLVSGVFGNGQGWDAFPMASTNSLLDGVKALVFGKADEMDAVGAASTAVEAGPVQEAVRAIASRYGWNTGAQWDSILKLVQGESGWNPNAANPTSSARGLFQKMTSLHGPIEPTAGGQALWGLEYLKRAYGTPVNAYAKWSSRSPHWYDTGGWLPPGATMSMNGTGAPEAVLTGRQWRDISVAADRSFPDQLTLTSGRLEIDGDGLIRIIDGRLVAAGDAFASGRRI